MMNRKIIISLKKIPEQLFSGIKSFYNLDQLEVFSDYSRISKENVDCVILIDPEFHSLIPSLKEVNRDISVELIVSNIRLVNMRLLTESMSLLNHCHFTFQMTSFYDFFSLESSIKIKNYALGYLLNDVKNYNGIAYRSEEYFLYKSDANIDAILYFLNGLDHASVSVTIICTEFDEHNISFKSNKLNITFKKLSDIDFTNLGSIRFLILDKDFCYSQLLFSIEVLKNNGLVIAPEIGVFKDLKMIFARSINLIPQFSYGEYIFPDLITFNKKIHQLKKVNNNRFDNSELLFNGNNDGVVESTSDFHMFNELNDDDGPIGRMFSWVETNGTTAYYRRKSVKLEAGNLLCFVNEKKAYYNKKTFNHLIASSMIDYRFKSADKNNLDYFCNASMSMIEKNLIEQSDDTFWLPDHENNYFKKDRVGNNILLLGGFLKTFFEIPTWDFVNFRLSTFCKSTKLIYEQLLNFSADSIGLIPKKHHHPVRNDFKDFVYAGRLSPSKNIDVLIKFFHHWQSTIDSTSTLYLYGAFDDEVDLFTTKKHDNYEVYIYDLIHSYNWVTPPFFMGNRGVEEWLHGPFTKPALITLSLYRKEDFGMSAYQALAAGWPIIVSDWGGHKDYSGEGIYKIPATILRSFVKTSQCVEWITAILHQHSFAPPIQENFEAKEITTTNVLSLYSHLRKEYGDTIFLVNREDTSRLLWTDQGRKFVFYYDYYFESNRSKTLYVIGEQSNYVKNSPQSDIVFIHQKNLSIFVNNAEVVYFDLELQELEDYIFYNIQNLKDKKIYIREEYKNSGANLSKLSNVNYFKNDKI